MDDATIYLLYFVASGAFLVIAIGFAIFLKKKVYGDIRHIKDTADKTFMLAIKREVVKDMPEQKLEAPIEVVPTQSNPEVKEHISTAKDMLGLDELYKEDAK